MAAVATKPFLTNYRIPTSTGYVVLNGEQITKIEAIKVADAFGMTNQGWKVVFHLSDGSQQTISHNAWTKKFVCDTFETEE